MTYITTSGWWRRAITETEAQMIAAVADDTTHHDQIASTLRLGADEMSDLLCTLYPEFAQRPDGVWTDCGTVAGHLAWIIDDAGAPLTEAGRGIGGPHDGPHACASCGWQGVGDAP